MKIGLVLSGGGILGVAHLSLLKQLKKHKIEVFEIAGCSSGAIIGSLYSAGGISRVEKFLDYLAGKGMFKSSNIKLPDAIFNDFKSALNVFLEGADFNNLRTSFSVVATDINTGKLVKISSGNLINAVLASSAYPGFFKTQKIDDKYLIDGGVLANLPVESLSKDADFILGSYLGKIQNIIPEEVKEFKIGRFATYSRAIDIAQDALCQKSIKKCHYCFIPPVTQYRWNSFHKMKNIMDLSDKYAEVQINQIVKMILKHENKKYK